MKNNNIQIVSVAQFERETGIHISHLTGKMKNVRAISSYAGQNPSCMCMMQNSETVCSHCYAYKQVSSGVYPNQRIALERNGKALSGALLNIVPNLSKQQVFRFESHGDVINETHARNFIRIAAANPNTRFAAFTKRPDVWAAAVEKEGKPDNLNLVFSSPLVNRRAAFVKEKYPCFDVVFTVYEKEHGIDGDVPCQCGPESCNKCRFCYTKQGCVGEILR